MSAAKAVHGNLSNVIGFVATPLMKRYLASRFGIADFDSAAKAQGAAGIDIDVRTPDGETIAGEPRNYHAISARIRRLSTCDGGRGYGAASVVACAPPLYVRNRSGDFRDATQTDMGGARSRGGDYRPGYGSRLHLSARWLKRCSTRRRLMAIHGRERPGDLGNRKTEADNRARLRNGNSRHIPKSTALQVSRI